MLGKIEVTRDGDVVTAVIHLDKDGQKTASGKNTNFGATQNTPIPVPGKGDLKFTCNIYGKSKS